LAVIDILRDLLGLSSMLSKEELGTWRKITICFGCFSRYRLMGWYRTRGVLPFASLSFGTRTSNIAFSGGYGSFWGSGSNAGRAAMSAAGMTKVSPKISLVFDSFILPPTINRSSFALIIPGIRWHQSEGKAIQFGFAGFIAEGEAFPLPIPMVQWFRKL